MKVHTKKHMDIQGYAEVLIHSHFALLLLVIHDLGDIIYDDLVHFAGY